MPTKAQLESELNNAMRAGHELKKSTLRMIIAAIRLAEVELLDPLEEDEGKIEVRGPLDKAGVEAILQKEAKSRRESIADAERANRPDLIARAQAELAIVESYLPKQLSRDEVAALVKAAIAESGASGPAAMGAVMKIVGPQTRGLADGKLVSDLVKSQLAGG